MLHRSYIFSNLPTRTCARYRGLVDNFNFHSAKVRGDAKQPLYLDEGSSVLTIFSVSLPPLLIAR